MKTLKDFIKESLNNQINEGKKFPELDEYLDDFTYSLEKESNDWDCPDGFGYEDQISALANGENDLILTDCIEKIENKLGRELTDQEINYIEKYLIDWAKNQ